MQQTQLLGTESDYKYVRISAKSLLQRFIPCLPEYIRSTCRGRCCEGSNGIMVTVHPSEETRMARLGATIKNGLIVADGRGLCPFKADNGLCSIHLEKPFGCRVSPFTLTKQGTLIVRNRYRLLRCYRGPGNVPVYQAHRQSLNAVFGPEETDRIIALLLKGEPELLGKIPTSHRSMLLDNDAIKRAAR